MVRVHPTESGRRRRGSRRGVVARVLITGIGAAIAAVALLAAALTVSEPLRARLREITGASRTHSGVAAVAFAPANLLAANLNRPPTPRIALAVKFKHMHKVHEKRSLALASGILATSRNPVGRASRATNSVPDWFHEIWSG